MSKKDDQIIYDSYGDSTSPKKLEFHFINGECLKLDLEKIDVQFKTGSNTLFTKNINQSPNDILNAISQLDPENFLYIRTSSKEEQEELTGNGKEIDKERVYLTQRSKITYVRAAY